MRELMAAYDQEYFAEEYSEGYTPIAELCDELWTKNMEGRIMVYGYTGAWDGQYYGGRYIDTREQLEDRMAGGNSIDDVRIYRVTSMEDETDDVHIGDIITTLSHHDGINVYTFRLTDAEDDADDVDEFKAQFKKAAALNC